MEPKKELTIRIYFGVGQRKPKDPEIFQFFRNHGWKWEELSAMYREDHSVYVKFQSMELMRKALLRLGAETTFWYADGTTTETMVMVAGGDIQYVRIFGLTPEIGDEEIRRELGKYGKVKQLCREKFAVETGFPIWNGVRGIFMEVVKDLPAQIKIQGKAARIYFDGLKDKCFGCGSEGHMKVNCPTRSSTGASFLSKQKSSSFAQVVANDASVLHPVKILDVSTVSNQAGEGEKGSDEKNRNSDNANETIMKENKTLAEQNESGKRNEEMENAKKLEEALSGTNTNQGKKKTSDYYRPWPKYR